MKLLITGTTGFIGQHLVKRLNAQGHSLTAIIRPTTDASRLPDFLTPYVFDGSFEKLSDFMHKEAFDGVIHLASLFLAQHKPDDIPNLIDSNITFPTTLLEASVANQVPWFLNTGTFWQHYESQPYNPVNLYAATKQAFEDVAHYYYGVNTINFVTLKLSDTFGPDDSRPKVLNLLERISKSGETLDMSPGEQILDISYIDNVIDGYLRLIALLAKDSQRKMCGQSYALTSSERMSLKALVKIFTKATGLKPKINWGKRPYRTREVMVPWTKGKPIPGWKPKVSLEEGIRRTFHA